MVLHSSVIASDRLMDVVLIRPHNIDRISLHPDHPVVNPQSPATELHDVIGLMRHEESCDAGFANLLNVAKAAGGEARVTDGQCFIDNQHVSLHCCSSSERKTCL